MINNENMVDGILSRFPVDTIHKFMKAVGWRWVLCDDGVPSAQEIYDEARRLLLMVMKEQLPANDHFSLQCGGLRALKTTDREGNLSEVSLAFIPEVTLFLDEESEEDTLTYNFAGYLT